MSAAQTPALRRPRWLDHRPHDQTRLDHQPHAQQHPLAAVCQQHVGLVRQLPDRRELHAPRRLLAATPDLGLRELTRQIAMATRYRISESTAAKLRDDVRAQSAPNEQDADAAD